MITFSDEEIKTLEDKVQYISHGASMSVKTPDGSLINFKWELAIENDGTMEHEKLVNFLRLQVYNRLNYDYQKSLPKYRRLAQEAKK